MVQKIKYKQGRKEPWIDEFVWIPDNLSDEDKLMYAEMNMNSTGIKFTEIKLAEPRDVSKYTGMITFWAVILGIGIGAAIVLFLLK